MTSIRVLASRLLDLLVARRRERRLEQEIADHLELLTDHYVAAGMAPAEARRAARRAFGGIDQMKEAHRDQRGLPFVDALRQDARFAIRLLARNRSFAATAVLVLAVGIGINNMLFTILNAHTLRGLPIPRSDRVLWISTIDDRGSARGLSVPGYRDLAAAAGRFERLAAFENAAMVLAGDGRAADRLDGAFVTAGAFDIIGAQPLLGRNLAESDDVEGAPVVAVITNTAWETRYHADPSALGRHLTVNGVPATVVGIVPDRSGFPSSAQVWLPLSHAPQLAARTREVRTLQVFGRVAGSVRVDEAIAEVSGIGERLQRAYPATGAKTRLQAVPINNRFLGNPRDPVWRAFMAVGFIVVLIACANVANLMLDRSLLRARELAIRTAVGGSRSRLLRQLLVEGAVLAAAGGGLGLLVATGAIRIFRAAIPGDALPYWLDYSIDWRVLSALIAVSAGTVLVFALVPAIQASRTDVLLVLKDGGGSTRRGRRRMWATVFLAGQIALAVILLAQVAVAIRSDRSNLPSDDALDTTEIVTAAVTLPRETYPSAADRLAFYDSLLARVHGLSAIGAAAMASSLPFGGGDARPVAVEGARPRDEKDERTSLAISITPDYFRALGLPLLQGRAFEASDGTTGRETAIVNEPFVQEFLAGDAVLGRRILVPAAATPEGAVGSWLTIVGVAPAIRQRRGTDSDPTVYLPFAAGAPAAGSIIVRGTAGTASVVAAIRQQVQALDPDLPVFRARTLPQVRHDADWNGRVSNRLFLFLTLIAVALATVGLYAVTAHGVSQQRHEIGIRIALGAGTARIVRRVVRRLLLQTVAGFAAGVALTTVWASMFSSGNATIRTTDPMSLALVGLMLAVLVSIAAIVPSRRASRVDPLVAIRE
jgi:putative ABC transport system permease protein